MARLLLTIPTWNEAVCIEQNLRVLIRACETTLLAHEWRIEIADNGSTDATSEIIKRFAHRDARVTWREISVKGKGGAIRESWMASSGRADVFVFLDADLAADVQALLRLVEPIARREAEAVVGSRFHPDARVVRSWWREGWSRGFHYWRRWALPLPVDDTQCGFKAVSSRVVETIVPLLHERGWLFDAELLAHIAARGWIIRSLPIDWIEHRDPRRRSAVFVWRDGWDFLIGVWRIRFRVKLSTARA